MQKYILYIIVLLLPLIYGGRSIRDLNYNQIPDITEEKSGFVNGKKEGESDTWFENGTLQSKRFYFNGEKDGTHYGWYENGAKRFEYNFENGLNTGLHSEWYLNGYLAKKTTYKNGQ